MLDIMLSNAANGFSCGEVHALFHPFNPYHIDPECTCGISNCNIWDKIKAYGEKRLYEGIFTEMPDIDFIVDSSKQPLWIRDQTANLSGSDIAVENLLIWKTPSEFALSCFKRGNSNWQRMWINYYKRYFACINKWHSVSYKDLATNTLNTLRRICNIIGIEYVEGKENFWNKIHHTLFGNTSTRIHLYDKKSENFAEKQSYIEKIKSNYKILPEIQRHQSIYYDQPNDRFSLSGDNDTTPWDISVHKIMKILEATEVENNNWNNTILSMKNEFRRGPFPFWIMADRSRTMYNSLRVKLRSKSVK